MRLMKYSFICPICDKAYYTYVEQKHYQNMFNNQIPVEENFKGYPDYYQIIIKTAICQTCQDVSYQKVCTLADNDREDEELQYVIEQLEYDAGRSI